MRVVATASTLLLLACVPCLRGASILSTFCSVILPDGSAAEATSTAACSVVGPVVPPSPQEPFAEAHAFTDSALLPPGSHEDFPDGAFWAVASAQTYVRTAPYQPFEPPSRAEASAELFLTAETAGPVRPGLIDLLFLQDIDIDFGVSFAQLQVMIGSLFAEVIEPSAPCRGACNGTFPFLLGQPFDIYVAAFSQASAEPIVSGGSSRRGEVQVLFQLRELDGTPVDLASVPEPSTIALLALGLVLLMLTRTVRESLRTKAPFDGASSRRSRT